MKAEPGDRDWDEIYALFEKVLESDFSEGEARRLDELVGRDEAVRRAWLEYAHQHACLHWGGLSVSDEENRELIASIAEEPKNVRSMPWVRGLLAAAACVALLVLGFYGGRRNAGVPEPPAVATLLKTKGCAWGEGTLPTGKGARLTSGRMRLVAGLATLRFESGAEVVLEAPAEIELVDAMRCVLHDGTLTAQVPPEAQGFVVDTASAHLVDHGTEFGVYVDGRKGTTDVQVFDGTVDVEQRTTREQQRMTAGQRSIVDGDRFEVAEAASHEAGPGVSRAGSDDFEAEALAITTAQGRGQDGYVQSVDRDDHVSETLLLVKNGKEDTGYQRKIYLAFDLEGFENRVADKARLRLQIERSGWGYASSVPDAEFAVYGLTDEDLDGRDFADLDWADAPGNRPGGAEVDPEVTTLLGRFTVPQGRYTGFTAIEGDALAEFINADSNGVATLIIVRDTPETRGGGLVHAFAGGSHPGGVPPTLFVSFE